MKVVRSSPLHTSRLYPQEYPGTHFFRGWVDPGNVSCQNKFQASSLGIDPGSSRLVAQCLNHCATPGPEPNDTCLNLLVNTVDTALKHRYICTKLSVVTSGKTVVFAVATSRPCNTDCLVSWIRHVLPTVFETRSEVIHMFACFMTSVCDRDVLVQIFMDRI